MSIGSDLSDAAVGTLLPTSHNKRGWAAHKTAKFFERQIHIPKMMGMRLVNCVFAASILALVSADYEPLNCIGYEDEVVFHLNLASMDFSNVGWRLGCDGTVVWDVPLGSLQHSGGAWLTEATCIDSEAMCVFELFNEEELRKSRDNFFLLRRGFDIVVGSEDVSPPQESYCSGPECTKKPVQDFIWPPSESSSPSTGSKEYIVDMGSLPYDSKVGDSGPVPSPTQGDSSPRVVAIPEDSEVAPSGDAQSLAEVGMDLSETTTKEDQNPTSPNILPPEEESNESTNFEVTFPGEHTGSSDSKNFADMSMNEEDLARNESQDESQNGSSTPSEDKKNEDEKTSPKETSAEETTQDEEVEEEPPSQEEPITEEINATKEPSGPSGTDKTNQEDPSSENSTHGSTQEAEQMESSAGIEPSIEADSENEPTETEKKEVPVDSRAPDPVDEPAPESTPESAPVVDTKDEQKMDETRESSSGTDAKTQEQNQQPTAIQGGNKGSDTQSSPSPGNEKKGTSSGTPNSDPESKLDDSKEQTTSETNESADRGSSNREENKSSTGSNSGPTVIEIKPEPSGGSKTPTSQIAEEDSDIEVTLVGVDGSPNKVPGKGGDSSDKDTSTEDEQSADGEEGYSEQSSSVASNLVDIIARPHVIIIVVALIVTQLVLIFCFFRRRNERRHFEDEVDVKSTMDDGDVEAPSWYTISRARNGATAVSSVNNVYSL